MSPELLEHHISEIQTHLELIAVCAIIVTTIVAVRAAFSLYTFIHDR